MCCGKFSSPSYGILLHGQGASSRNKSCWEGDIRGEVFWKGEMKMNQSQNKANTPCNQFQSSQSKSQRARNSQQEKFAQVPEKGGEQTGK